MQSRAKMYLGIPGPSVRSESRGSGDAPVTCGLRNMSTLDLDAPAVNRQELMEAASRLNDEAWAQTVLGVWQREVSRPVVRSWVFQLGLVAANSLGRAEEFIPLFDRFLANYDLQTKPDWHAELTDSITSPSMLAQSGRIGQSVDAFAEEFKSTVVALGHPNLGPVIDVGCAGGAYAINLAKLGYQVFGTDHHAGIIETAKRNATSEGVTDRTSFAVDEACSSQIPDGSYSRAICIGVTPCLPNDAAFEALVSHLDRITRPKAATGPGRRVILGSNRWGPSRLSALRGILLDSPVNLEQAVSRLSLVQDSWWMQQQHTDTLKKYFPSVKVIREVSNKVDGVRIDFLLQ